MLSQGAVVLVPVGPVSADLTTWLADRLAEVLRQQVALGDGIPLPDDAYDPRRQYLGVASISARPSSTPLAGSPIPTPVAC